ncbi:hypothetical protein BY996DRAFT_6455139 [Phakopsora pachyrhizi]|uniref:Uncharacterized protein n=1 Tax=Phakopsora pachyrhizi TaxID=170000 RepID=A0AAV0BIE4_PHAPC|nr:hypothetical protein BY996DRAFT_6455139 [Phakopsora pachyrhizi]CAH7687077.1 hypothetical protein PPACK8108_LOCUS21810 [Phakopsora pachyrhizi]
MRLEDTVILCKFFCPKTPTSPATSTTTTVLQQTPIKQQQQQQQQHSPLKSDTKNFRIQVWNNGSENAAALYLNAQLLRPIRTTSHQESTFETPQTSFQTETRMSMQDIEKAFSSAVSMIENNPCKISGEINGGGGLNISKGNS